MRNPLAILFAGAVALLASSGLQAQNTVRIHSTVDSPVVVISADELRQQRELRNMAAETSQNQLEEKNVFLQKNYRVVLGIQNGKAREETTLLVSRSRFRQQVSLLRNGRQEISLSGLLRETPEGRLALEYNLETTLAPDKKGGFGSSMSSRAAFPQRESQSGHVFLSPGGAEQLLYANGERSYLLKVLPEETTPVAEGELENLEKNYRVTLEINSDGKTTQMALSSAGPKIDSFMADGASILTGTLRGWKNGTLGLEYSVRVPGASFAGFSRLKSGEAQPVFTSADERYTMRVEALDDALQVSPQGEARPPNKNYLMTLTCAQNGKRQEIATTIASNETNVKAAANAEEGKSIALSVSSFLVWENDHAVFSYKIINDFRSGSASTLAGVLRMKPGVAYPIYKTEGSSYELRMDPAP